MVEFRGQFVSLFVTILISTSSPVCNAAKKPVFAARSEDIPYIKCQVCEKLASQLHSQVQMKQTQIAPKKVSEYQIIEIAENVCNLKKVEADWIMKIDIVEHGDKLGLVEQEEEGLCNAECKTIEKACQQILGDHDTDVAEYIYSSKPKVESLINYLCKDVSNACRQKPPPVPKDRIPGESFVPKPSKDVEMEKLMKSMEGMPGASNMKMYSRDDLMTKNFGNDGDDDEDDDDDEDMLLRRNLAKSMAEKQQGNDWKQKVANSFINAGETVKRHGMKISTRLQRWWSRKTSHKSEL